MAAPDPLPDRCDSARGLPGRAHHAQQRRARRARALSRGGGDSAPAPRRGVDRSPGHRPPSPCPHDDRRPDRHRAARGGQRRRVGLGRLEPAAHRRLPPQLRHLPHLGHASLARAAGQEEGPVHDHARAGDRGRRVRLERARRAERRVAPRRRPATLRRALVAAHRPRHAARRRRRRLRPLGRPRHRRRSRAHRLRARNSMNRLDTDHTSGSTGVARSFLDQLERWAAMDTSTSPPALRAALLRHLREAQAAQPAMALIHQLAVRALDVASTGVARGDAVPDLRAHIAQSCAAEREDLAAQQAAVARTAAQLATMREPWIATLSSSSAVRDALLELQRKGKGPRVLVAESRPLNEGRALAAELAEAGIPTWLVVDAALPLLISQAAMVWIGADAVTDRGVLNKVGSYGVALAAPESSVPVYALAMRRKFLPASTTALQI